MGNQRRDSILDTAVRPKHPSFLQQPTLGNSRTGMSSPNDMRAAQTQTPSHLAERHCSTLKMSKPFLSQRKLKIFSPNILIRRTDGVNTCGSQSAVCEGPFENRCSTRPKAKAKEKDLENIDALPERASLLLLPTSLMSNTQRSPLGKAKAAKARDVATHRANGLQAKALAARAIQFVATDRK